MEAASKRGVLNHLSLLEVQARNRKTRPRQRSRVEELNAKVAALTEQRDRLKAEIHTHQKLKESMDKRDKGEDEEMDEDSENSKLLRLMARHSQLKDLLQAHDIIGGYNVIKTLEREGVCVSLATAYDGVYLETYNMEIDLKRKLRISRHNIPPFIPVSSLAEQYDMHTDIRTFLDVLSQHLNAFAGRKQQLKLLKELHTSVEVMESNVLCSILVMMFIVPTTKMAVLCTLDYSDHTRCLPTRVQLDCEEKTLPDSPEWKKNCSLLMEVPVHKALDTMRKMETIV